VTSFDQPISLQSQSNALETATPSCLSYDKGAGFHRQARQTYKKLAGIKL
jgi:hypothetical protein